MTNGSGLHLGNDWIVVVHASQGNACWFGSYPVFHVFNSTESPSIGNFAPHELYVTLLVSLTESFPYFFSLQMTRRYSMSTQCLLAQETDQPIAVGTSSPSPAKTVL